jgi:hypothetical protein
LFVPPPYRIAPEDTLLYCDYVILHKRAADELSTRYPRARVLTAWPASDELTRPWLGYVTQPLDVVRIENFSPLEIELASRATDQFDVAYLFSTKWEPAHPMLSDLFFGKAIQEKFFDYHRDMLPQPAATILGGRIVSYQNWNNEWVGPRQTLGISSADFRYHLLLFPPINKEMIELFSGGGKKNRKAA